MADEKIDVLVKAIEELCQLIEQHSGNAVLNQHVKNLREKLPAES